jgi:MFS family permease
MFKVKNKFIIKLAILCLALQDVGAGAATPALGAIQAAFPEVDPTLIQMISTIPSLTVVIFGLLYAPMSKVMPKRGIMYIAAATFLIGGIAPAFLNDIYLILVFRALVGVGVGLLYPMANDLAVDFFEGGERAKTIGQAFGIGMIGGAFFQFIGGALSDIDWHYTFFAYFVSVLFFAFPVFFLPEPKKKEDVVKGTAQEKAKMPVSQFISCIINAICCLLFITLITNAAMVIAMEGFGSGAEIGLAFSVMTLAAFVAGFLYGPSQKVLKLASMVPAPLLLALGLFVMSTAQSMAVVFCAMILFGLGMGYCGSKFFAKSTEIVPFAVSALALSMMTAFNGLGQLLSAPVMNWLVTATGIGMGRPALAFAAIAMIVLGIIMVIFDIKTPKIPDSERPEGTEGAMDAVQNS